MEKRKDNTASTLLTTEKYHGQFSRKSTALVSISGFVIVITTLLRSQLDFKATALQCNTLQKLRSNFLCKTQPKLLISFMPDTNDEISNAALFLLLAHVSTRSSSVS